MSQGHDIIGFEIIDAIEPDYSEAPVRKARIIINQHDLLPMVREYERVYAEKEGHIDLAGGYVEETLENLRTKLVTPEKWPFTYDNEVSVLVCNCREEGCWPLMVRITRTGRTVTWSHFNQPHRDENSPSSHWDYSGFGPFVFEQAQYEAALSTLIEG